jgi:hypothetical protein
MVSPFEIFIKIEDKSSAEAVALTRASLRQTERGNKNESEYLT